jgi:hypothetical protein
MVFLDSEVCQWCLVLCKAAKLQVLIQQAALQLATDVG